MYKFLVIAAFVACASATPGVVAPLAAPVAYANAPLYAAGGSSQVDVRHNYDGTQSSYTTAPFDLTAPYSSRYVSGIPATYAAAAPYAAAHLASPYAAQFAAPYTAPYAAPFAAPYAAPFASPYAAPYSFGAPLAASYAAPYAAPYSFPAQATVVA